MGLHKWISMWSIFYLLVILIKHHEKILNILSYAHLAVYVVIFSKHKPASDARSEEGVRLELLTLYLLLNSLQTFIREHKAGQVPGVGVSGLSYRSKLLSQTVVRVRYKYKITIKMWTLMQKLHLISIEYYLVRFSVCFSSHIRILICPMSSILKSKV